MKKIEIGNVYSAHCFDEFGERVQGKGFYHFRILESQSVFMKIDGNLRFTKIHLGLKIGVDVSPYDFHSQCFWFDENGTHKSMMSQFKLTRKVKHKCVSEQNQAKDSVSSAVA